MSKKALLSFDEARRELQISEEDLEKLVAQGGIACVKDGDSMFFKPEVVMNYKKGRKSEPTIILSDDEMDLLDGVDEINLDEFDMPAESAKKGAGSRGGDSTDILPSESGAAGIDDLNLEDIELPDLGGDEPSKARRKSGMETEGLEGLSLGGAEAGGSEDTVLSLDNILDEGGASESATPVPGTHVHDLNLEEAGDDITLEGSVSEDTILDTDVLDLTDEDDAFQLDDAAKDELTAAATASTLLRGGGSRVMQMKRVKSSNWGWTALLLGTALLMLVPVGVLVNLYFYDQHDPRGMPTQRTGIANRIKEWNFLQGPVESLADTVHEIAGN